LDSVLIQSFADLEVIVVTNDSPPDTMAIIERYIDKDPRVRAFYYDNDSGNACRGRNRGIIEARGEFISFLDSDDLYFPDTLKTVYEIFSTHDVDFVAGRASWIVDGSRKVGRMATGDTNQPCAINMAVLMRGNPFMTCTVHIKRDLLLKHGGFRPEQEYYEDLELWLRLAHRGCKFHYAAEIFAKYRLHAGNTELKYVAARQHWMAQMRHNYTRPFLEWGV
jgi:glycosyltransferase involved in cell wall biosynthesis